MEPLRSNGDVLGMFVIFWTPLPVVRTLLTTGFKVKINSWNERRKGAENFGQLHVFHLRLPFTSRASLNIHMLNTYMQSDLNERNVPFKTTFLKTIQGTQT
jgi:hypothetical protein